MAVDKSLMSGSMTMLLLRLLAEKDMYGYGQEYAGKTRKYYSITKEGRKLLETKKAEWMEYQSAVTSVLAMGV